MTPRVLIVDNRDSFVHTLAGYLEGLGAATHRVEADEITDVQAQLRGHDAVMISPGPGRPEDAGASVAVARAAAAAGMPLLGVCLGHQAIAVAFGGVVDEAPELMHGMVSEVLHEGTSVFSGIPSPFPVGRYHSLAVREISAPLRVTARTLEGTIMALEHASLPIVGVQFHPESILTEHGHRLLANWLVTLGLSGAAARADELSPFGGIAHSADSSPAPTQ